MRVEPSCVWHVGHHMCAYRVIKHTQPGSISVVQHGKHGMHTSAHPICTRCTILFALAHLLSACRTNSFAIYASYFHKCIARARCAGLESQAVSKLTFVVGTPLQLSRSVSCSYFIIASSSFLVEAPIFPFIFSSVSFTVFSQRPFFLHLLFNSQFQKSHCKLELHARRRVVISAWAWAKAQNATLQAKPSQAVA